MRWQQLFIILALTSLVTLLAACGGNNGNTYEDCVEWCGSSYSAYNYPTVDDCIQGECVNKPHAYPTVDLKGGDTCTSDPETYIEGWGVPAAQGGYYGGQPYDDFCLVLEPSSCNADDEGTPEEATVALLLPPPPQTITIRHLDGISNRDSFDVYEYTLDNPTNKYIGSYHDSQDDEEEWVTTSFDVELSEGVHYIVIKLTDEPWDGCSTWGQLAVDYITVESENDNAIPEFGVIGVGLLLIGAGLFILKKKH